MYLHINICRKLEEKDKNNSDATVQRRQGRPNLSAAEFFVK